jgi:hypothetical protein
VLVAKPPIAGSYQYAASAVRPAMRMAARSLPATPTTREAGDARFNRSPTVTPMKWSGEAARPGPGSEGWRGSSTTFTMAPAMRSYQAFATIPLSRAWRPESRSAWPGPVSEFAWR